MTLRMAILALAACLAAAACGAEAPAPEAKAPPTVLDAPSLSSEPSRVFAPANDAARAATGQLTVSMTLRLPDADQASADATDILTLSAGNGLVVEARITGAVSPATQIQGQTLRALLDIPVEEPQTLVYQVTGENRPEGAPGLCNGERPAYVVLWEPAGPGEPVMKLIGVMGAAPGAAEARACPMLEYRRT